MAQQMIISVSREYGAGGHDIADRIAKHFGFKLYDSNILTEVAEAQNVDYENLQKYDEKPRNVLFARKVLNEYNSNEDITANAEFEYLKSKAAEGESMVIVGRCSDAIFAGDKRLVSVFVTGTKEKKVSHIMEKYGMSNKEAAEKCAHMDKQRKQYHDSHTESKWGETKYYDICINSSKLGLEETAKVLISYIEKYMEV